MPIINQSIKHDFSVTKLCRDPIGSLEGPWLVDSLVPADVEEKLLSDTVDSLCNKGRLGIDRDVVEHGLVSKAHLGQKLIHATGRGILRHLLLDEIPGGGVWGKEEIETGWIGYGVRVHKKTSMINVREVFAFVICIVFFFCRFMIDDGVNI